YHAVRAPAADESIHDDLRDRHGKFANHFCRELLLQHVLRQAGGAQPLAREQPGMDGAKPAGPRQLRLPADRLPRPVRIRLARSRYRLLPANAAAAERPQAPPSQERRSLNDSSFRGLLIFAFTDFMAPTT